MELIRPQINTDKNGSDLLNHPGHSIFFYALSVFIRENLWLRLESPCSLLALPVSVTTLYLPSSTRSRVQFVAEVLNRDHSALHVQSVGGKPKYSMVAKACVGSVDLNHEEACPMKNKRRCDAGVAMDFILLRPARVVRMRAR